MALPVERRRVEVDGRGLLAVEAGTGPRTIVLVHGFGADHVAWTYNHPALAAASRVVAVDLPGHGGSDLDVGDGGLPVFSRAVEGLLEALDLSGVHLVGHSLGGAACLMAAATSGRVARLTLVAPLGFSASIHERFLADFVEMDDTEGALAALRHLVARPGLVGQQMAAGVLAAVRRPGAREALERIKASIQRDGRQALDLRPVLAGLGVPAQVIWGGVDAVLPPDGAAGLPDRIPVTVIPDAGHMPQMEAARAVNRAIEAFASA